MEGQQVSCSFIVINGEQEWVLEMDIEDEV